MITTISRRFLLLTILPTLSMAAPAQLHAVGTGYQFGRLVAKAPDVNGDGHREFVVWDITPQGTGVIRTFDGRTAVELSSLLLTDPTTIPTYGYGWAPANVGDVTGDGIEDIAIGISGSAGGSANGLELWSLTGGGWIQHGSRLEDPFAALRWIARGVEDIDGDGHRDIAMASSISGQLGFLASYASPALSGHGSVQHTGLTGRNVVSLGRSPLTNNVILLWACKNSADPTDTRLVAMQIDQQWTASFMWEYPLPGAEIMPGYSPEFGYSLEFNPANNQLYVGGYDCGPDGRGRVYVFSMDAQRSQPSGFATITPAPGLSSLSTPMLLVDDLDGRGNADLMVAALDEPGPKTVLCFYAGEDLAPLWTRQLEYGGQWPTQAAWVGKEGTDLFRMLYGIHSNTSNYVHVVRFSPPQTYGSGCPGTGGLTPQLTVTSMPYVGHADFAFRITSGQPNSIGVLGIATNQDSFAIGGGCTLLIQELWALVGIGPLDATGSSSWPLPIPATPALLGALVHAQAGLLDPAGSFVSLLSLSHGLSVRVGD